MTFSATAAPQAAKKLSANGPRQNATTQVAKPMDQAKNGFRVLSKRTASPLGSFSLTKAMPATRVAAPGSKLILRENVNMPNLQGVVLFQDNWSEDYQPAGIYRVLNGGELEEVVLGPAGNGIALDGVFYSTSLYSFLGMFYIASATFYDLETGEVLASPTVGNSDVAIVSTVDPTTDQVYTVNYNDNIDGLNFCKTTYSLDGVSTTVIAPMEVTPSALACDAAGQLYMIDAEAPASLYKLDKTSGELTYVGNTGESPYYITGATIDAATGTMYWALSPEDGGGYLTTVDLTTGAATKLFDLTENAELAGLFVAKPLAEAGAPAAAENLAAAFEGGSLNGKVTFTAPSTLFDGSAATGNVDWAVYTNGEKVANGSCAYGATVEQTVTVAQSGEYEFMVILTNAVGDSPKAKTKLYVGYGVPATTTATLVYEDGKMKLSWTPVTTTIEGGYIDAAAVTYTVTDQDGNVKAEKIAATSFEEEVAEPEQITRFCYNVVAHSEDLTSAAATSNVITLGAIVPPYSNDFADETMLDGFTLIDANGDGKVWTAYNGTVRMQYNSQMAMDDWLITPPMKLEANKAYKVSFTAYCQGTTFPERLEVMWGNAATAEAMTNVLLEPTDITLTSAEAVTYEGYVAPQTDGTYYVGFHGISDADMFYLNLDNLVIEAGATAGAPGKATNLTLTPDATGDYNVTVAFNAPAVDFSGNELSALTSVVVKREGEVVKTFENPAPGEALSFVDVVGAAGTVTYTVQGFNADGEGQTLSGSVFVGTGKPAAPANIVITEVGNTAEVTVTWDAVTTDAEGNAINPAKVTYLVATKDDGNGWVPVSDELTECSFTFQYCDPAQQTFAQVAIFATTEGGQTGAGSDLLAVGAPYDGLEESFADATLSYIWGTGYAANEGAWSIYDDESIGGLLSQDGDNGYAAMRGQYLESVSSLFTGKVKVPTTSPGISVYFNAIRPDSPDEWNIYVKELGDAEWTKLGETIVNNVASGFPADTPEDADMWYNQVISLEAYAGKTVQVRFEAITVNYVYHPMDNIKITSLAADNLKAKAIAAPARVKAGETYNVDVTVANEGTATSGVYAVELYTNGQLDKSIECEALASGKSATVSFECAMSPVADEAVEHYAVIVYAADEVVDNNTTTTVEVAPVVSKLPAPLNLVASADNDAVLLTWEDPDLSGSGVETKDEDFESGEAFAQEFEGWTFVDVDASPVGGFQSTEVPGITVGESTAAFFVFEQSDAYPQFNQTFAAHSGNKYLAALFMYDDSQSDDWAISPVLSGDAQTVTFFAKSYSSSYPEMIEMCYSTGSLNPADFVVVKTVATVPADWTEYSFDVPAGAAHFAIRSCATGSFMLMLDDFTFETAGSGYDDLVIEGFNIYRNGVKINDEVVEDYTFRDNVAVNNDKFRVTCVYSTGESAPSNEATYDPSAIDRVDATVAMVKAVKGQILVSGAEGQLVTVCTIDGKTIFSSMGKSAMTINATTGVYVVTVGKNVAKVLVR